MTKVIQPIPIKRNDLIKDYINFALIIILSFFFTYDAKELVLSIWFYGVFITYSSILVHLFSYNKLIKKNFKMFLYVILQLLLAPPWFSLFFWVQLIFINSAFYAETLEQASTLDIENFIYFIPFLPFVVYKYKNYFKPIPINELKKDCYKIQNIFSLVFKTQFLAIISLPLGIAYKNNPHLAYIIIYTLFFFPFTKTYKFLKQKKEAK